MPRPRRNDTSRTKESTLRKDNSLMNSTAMDSKPLDNNRMKLRMWKAEVKDFMKNAITNLNDMHKEKIESFELFFKNSLLGIPKSELGMVIDINDENFRAAFLGIEENKEEKNKSVILASPVRPPTVKRRSRSATNVKITRKTSQRIRSTSADMFKTPKGHLGLSSLMSSKKYTVTKPKKVENSGVHVKRIMKPDEEAISTCGSPLYVPACTLGAPHVNIPLPGGVVLNIEPKVPRGSLDIPMLDEKTKSQIKILCDQLKKLV